MDNRESVIFVTGASSGIGNASATYLAKKGMRVYGTCRNPSAYVNKADEFFEMLALELSDPTSITKAADKLLAKEGRIDALVCCAGSGLIGPLEEVGMDEAEALIDANLLGTIRTIKAFLPSMREAGRGRIIIAGAMEGLVASPFQSIFSAAEFALEGLAQALRLEVARFGVEIGILELASFRTAFGQRRRMATNLAASSPYKDNFENAVSVLGKEENEGLDPLIASRAIYSMLGARRMPPRVSLGPARRRFFAYAQKCFGTRFADLCVKSHFKIV